MLCLILAVTAVCSVILAVVMFSYTENSSCDGSPIRSVRWKIR